jgi:hypothetical protein
MNVRYQGQSFGKEKVANRNQNTFIRACTRGVSVTFFRHVLRHSTMLTDLDKYSGGEGQCNLNSVHISILTA